MYSEVVATASIPKLRHNSLLTLAEGMTTDLRSFVTMNKRCEANTYTAEQHNHFSHTRDDALLLLCTDMVLRPPVRSGFLHLMTNVLLSNCYWTPRSK